ncbi:MAG TPA: hypothetical protein VHN20_06200, partial [Beijerinckiaceae bacterium]|nr:hypothetical protein [Beijerinckiaceae bacterium]
MSSQGRAGSAAGTKKSPPQAGALPWDRVLPRAQARPETFDAVPAPAGFEQVAAELRPMALDDFDWPDEVYDLYDASEAARLEQRAAREAAEVEPVLTVEEETATFAAVPAPAPVESAPVAAVAEALTPIAVPAQPSYDFDGVEYELFDPEPDAPPEPEVALPPMVVELLAVEVKPAAAPPAKPLAPYGIEALDLGEVATPRLSAKLVRRRTAVGPNPNVREQAAPIPDAAVETAAATEPAAETPKPLPTPAPVPPKPVKPVPAGRQQPAPARPAPSVTVKPVPPSEKTVELPPAAAAKAPSQMVEPAMKPAPQTEKRQARPDTPKPAIALGSALPVDAEPPVAPAKPKVTPIRKAEAAPPVETPITIGLSAQEVGSGFWSGASTGVKGGIAAALLLVVGGGAYLMFGTGASKPVAAAPTVETAGPVVGGGGWTSSWGTDAAINKNKHISLYRPSMPMSDYRFEFKGQIERKALGWIFRAQDSRNYYVMKLETLQPGPNPVVALVRYPVVNGKEGTHTQVVLPFSVKADTVYDVQLDVSGGTFTTHIQGKLVDHWIDN